ncbi:hypothetical protein BDV95DRAFT_490786 [Massariosphaeria phaeospora]|uniref:C2H2-type domain-containing protein n=1 Tax=Massariosphaeria phaeospora TaxID=100035 RepID=A0A7C8IFK0_9PLEO|nr:hypothetical protein BDV95DRAFT_490786 [Massariosphaeria phaeospora]
MCDGSFDTKAALTQHQRNHPDVQSEHLCNVCNWPFSDSLQLEAHEIQAGHGQPAYQCPSCSQPFPTSTLLAQHRKFPKPCSDAFRAKEAQNGNLRNSARLVRYVDLDAPIAVPESTLQYYPASETVASNNNPKNYNLHCAKCQESFRSQARFDLHGLACRPRNSASAEVDPPKFKTLKSVYPPGFFDRPVKVPSEEGPSSTNRPHLTPRRPSAAMNRAPPQGPPVSTPPPPAAPVGGGPADMEQVSFICGKMLPLLLQADVTIYHDGKVTYNGIDWRRIGSGMQANAIGMVGKLCHLPVKLQGEYLPSPQTFRDEYSAQYSAEDFAASPSRSPATSGYPVIALSCSKIVLADGCQEVVKIAAIDVLTCRILMHHLVCPDPKATVKNWQTGITGLSRFSDIEAARQAGYKVLKGWQAARAALWKLITKDTIIIGHNLRSDLDALRMIHGRAVDVAKSVEKAADGPLSKTQLSLDSLSRDFNGTALTTHRTFGRDCLQDAFAARGLCLCIIKDGDAVARRARRMSLDYQVVVNSTTGV